MSKPSLPQGTRDFGATVVRKRNYIFQTIRTVFELYGFQPIETPAMENLDTLMGKYGDEGDKLIFKILNNGLDNPNKLTQTKEAFDKVLSGKSSKEITERALRYDLTIPFARYVAMNFGQLTMPFKRYQVQPVWRADRPQRGRYREFYQCDCDVVGSKSLLNEVELVSIYSQVFDKLGVAVEIKINSRKILQGLAEIVALAAISAPEQKENISSDLKLTDITVAIDKLDKIGLDKVKEELSNKGLNPTQIAIIEKYLTISGDTEEKINQLQELLGNNSIGNQGIEEIEYVLNYQTQTPNSQLQPDFTLARGLNYYTGIIFEVKSLHVEMGSIGGGGRYDDLTGLFGVPDVPGVGISFGVDRIYDVMEELKVFPQDVQLGTQVLFFNLGEAESKAAFALMRELRMKGVCCELFHENAKFDKQFKYAEKKQIPYAIILGSEELQSGSCVVKNLLKGEQQTIPLSALASFPF